MDTRFSSAIHILIMIAGSERPLTSETIAGSVGTNPSYIRKITALLKKTGILDSRQGIHGFSLLIPPAELSLYMVYQAINESDEVHVFDLHQNPNDECIVGRHIRPVLTETFREVEEQAEQRLKQTTLADCMEKMRIRIGEEQ
ncbi:MAG: Rrf2 family transcriptional regulator [Oscillospiraceae bacterium]|nr:Rrf2 family transcriptional regulator [Oscillospiraceae bacterium]